jgi:hypothetical protein
MQNLLYTEDIHIAYIEQDKYALNMRTLNWEEHGPLGCDAE